MKKEFIFKESIQKLFDNSSSVLFRWNSDAEWSIDYVSENVSELLGYSSEEFIQKKISYTECIAKSCLEQVSAEVKHFSENGSDFFRHKPYKIITKSGEIKWVLDETLIERDESGHISHYIGYIQDISESMHLSKQNEQRNSRLDLAIESINDGIWDWDLKSNKVYYSPQWKSMLGYSESEITNTPEAFFSLIHPDDIKRVEETLHQHLEGKKSYITEVRLRTKDGSYKWILSRGKAYFDQNGEAERIIGSHVDISHQKEVEEQLEESELRWKFALEGSGDGLWDWNLQSNEIYFSKQWKNMFGFKESEIVASLDEWSKRVHPDHLEKVYADINNYLEGKTEKYINEHQVLCKDGNYKWILDRGVIVSRDKEGNPTRMIGTHTDIDASKKSQERIRLLNQRFINMFKTHAAIMLLIEADSGKIIDANRSAQKFYGYSDKEFRSLNINQINKLSPQEIKKEREAALNHKKNSFIFQHTKKDGSTAVVEVHVSPIESEQGTVLFSIIKDVTLEKKNEKRLEKALQQLQEAQMAAKLGIWELNHSTGELLWSDEIYNIFEIDPEKFAPSYENFLDTIHPDDKEKVNKAFSDSLIDKKEYEISHRLLMRDGRIKYVREQGKSTFNEEGEALVSLGTVQDISELQLLDETVKKERKRYKDLMELSSDGIFIIDKEFKLIEYSQMAKKMLGYSDEEMRNLSIPDWDRGANAQILSNHLASLSTDTPISFETVHTRKDGTTYDASISSILINIDGEKYIYSTTRDISDIKKLQNEMLYEKNFISSLVDGANAIIAVIDASGTMIKLNRYGEEFTGCTQQEISQEPYKWKVFLPKSIQNNVLEIVEKAKRGEIVHHYENAWISKSGEERIFEWTNNLITKEDGSFDYISTIGIDITQRKKEQLELQKAKEHAELLQLKSQLALKASKTGIWEWNLENNTLIWDEQMCSIYDVELKEEENPYSLWSNAINANERNRTEKLLHDALESGTEYNTSFWINTPSNEKRYIHAIGVNEYDKQNNVIGMVGTNTDITEQKNYELNLTEALTFRSKFLSNMSHEIRTPLNGIIGITQVALREELNERQKDLFKKIESSSNLLLGIINDILDISKIEAGKMSIEQVSFDLYKLVHTLESIMSVKAAEKNIAFEIEFTNIKHSHYIGDALRLSQVLNNLLSNALKFTDEGYVKLRISEEKNGLIRFEVIDSGIGLHEEDIENLFEEFTQADMSTSRKFGGTGLGLAITKSLVSLMNGTISVESEFSKGSTFSVTLPLEIATNEIAEEKESTHNQMDIASLEERVNSLQDIKILVAEDNQMNQMVLSMLLEETQIKLEFADDGLICLEKVQESSFDLIFMDIQMPNMNGYDATQEIRKFDTDTPIIGLSANVLQEEIEQAMSLGMNDYLAKPIEAEKLYASILKFLT